RHLTESTGRAAASPQRRTSPGSRCPPCEKGHGFTCWSSFRNPCDPFGAREMVVRRICPLALPIDVDGLRMHEGDPMDWRHRAACLTEDPELFFPIGNTGPALVQIDEAKAVCQRCTVVDTCLKWAMETGQDSGVWGGLSEDERRALKRR